MKINIFENLYDKEITEIADNPHHIDKPPQKYNHIQDEVLKNLQRFINYENYKLGIIKLTGGSDLIGIALNQENRIVSVMETMNDEDIGKYHRIYSTWTSSDYRNNGIMKGLVNLFVSKEGNLFSDSKQTISAQMMWKSLLNNTAYNPVIYNTDTDEIQKYDKSKDSIIWNNDLTNIIVGLMK